MFAPISLALLTSPAAAQVDWELAGSRVYFDQGSFSSLVADAAESSDGAVYLCGRRNVTSVPSFPVDALLAKVDRSTGDVLWERVIRSSVLFSFALDVVPQADGGVIVVGGEVESGIEPDSVAIVARYDASGGLLWQTRLTRTAQAPGANFTVAHSAAADGQGGVLLAGFERIPGVHPQRATIFRVDANGQELPSVAPFGNAQSELYDVEPSQTGGYLVALGNTAGNFAGMLDASFNPVWFTTLSAPGGFQTGPVFHRSIVEDEMGNIFGMLSGTTLTREPRLVRLDPANGAVLWSMNPLPGASAPAGTIRGRARRIEAKSGGGVWVPGQLVLLPGASGVSPYTGMFARAIAPDGVATDAFEYERQGPGFFTINGAVITDDLAYIYGSTSAPELGSTIPPGASAAPTLGLLARAVQRVEIGTPYCTPAFPNSTGVDGQIVAAGTAVAADDDVVLSAFHLPPEVTALFVLGSEQGVTPLQGGSAGVLCIAGNLGRFNGSIGTATSLGLFRYQIDTQDIPTALGPIAATAGLTLNFQCWHRDTIGGGSNTTNAVSLTFD